LAGDIDEAVAVVLARSGSSRFPGKNIAYLGSKRLIEWALSAALDSGAVSRVYLSTDSKQYAEIAEKAGASSILRPPEFATETATSEATMGHALGYLAGIGVNPQIVAMQQATTPLTKPETIRKAITAVRNDFDTAQSVVLADKKPWWALKMNPQGGLEPFMVLPQDSRYNVEVPPPLYYPTGGVYTFKTEFFRRTNRVTGGKAFGVSVEWYEAIDIDYEHDLEFARWALQYLLSKKNPQPGAQNP
jgi:CMP-N,N'-diacetyllegionaminic acid synthase